MSSVIDDVERESSNKQPNPSGRYQFVQVIQAISELMEKNKYLLGLIALIMGEILTKENLVATFGALKGLSITLGFGG